MGGVIYTTMYNTPDIVKAEPEKTFREIAIEDTKNPSYDIMTLSSSNPWDYVDETYYDSIIKLGTDAIQPLDELMKSGEISGPYEYVSAIALEEITGCKMKDTQGHSWSNVEQFYEMWDSTMETLPETLEAIKDDTQMSVQDKIDETNKYGIFGKAFAWEVISGETEICGIETESITDNELVSKYREICFSVDEKDLENAMEYMVSKEN